MSMFILLYLLQQGDPKATEMWKPVPPVVNPRGVPSDAINLSKLDAWQRTDGGESKWTQIQGGFVVKPGTGEIKSKRGFGDCQLHIEWASPQIVKGEGQGRGNSGIFFMGRYELQVLDSFENTTYSNGQAASIYKQHIPLVNASLRPGMWQTYDAIFTAPRFKADGELESPARITVLHNGVLVLNNVTLSGPTEYIGKPVYKAHGPKEPIHLQDHGDLVSYRNIWVRDL
jgi:hypothetical protein